MGLSNSVCHVTSVYVAMCARLRETVYVCVCVCERDRLRLYVSKHILYIMHIYAYTCLTVHTYIYTQNCVCTCLCIVTESRKQSKWLFFNWTNLVSGSAGCHHDPAQHSPSHVSTVFSSGWAKHKWTQWRGRQACHFLVRAVLFNWDHSAWLIVFYHDFKCFDSFRLVILCQITCNLMQTPSCLYFI